MSFTLFFRPGFPSRSALSLIVKPFFYTFPVFRESPFHGTETPWDFRFLEPVEKEAYSSPLILIAILVELSSAL